MKKLSKYLILSLCIFLLVFTLPHPVNANSWGDPLATDPSSDGSQYGEDILAVDAMYANEFVYFRFQLNEPVMNLEYLVFIGYDCNLSNGYSASEPEADSGPDLYLRCNPGKLGSDIIVGLYLFIYGLSTSSVTFNVTANNGSAMSWSSPSVIPNFVIHTFQNGSQGELAFGVNWTWVVEQMVGLGSTGDGSTLLLEFRATSGGTDWCLDRTEGTTDYIEWNIYPPDGIPGFSTGLVFLGLLILLAVIVSLEQKQLKF